MNKPKRIFIIGHMGAGKGILAKTLAEKLGWKFVDADFGLEHMTSKTLTEILGKQGEETFQHSQTQIVEHLIKQENIVVTTDSSILATEKSRKLLSTEYVVYLKVSLPIQVERYAHNYIALLPATNHKAFLEKLHHERNDLFEKAASFSLSSDDGEIEKHVASIIKAYSAHES